MIEIVNLIKAYQKEIVLNIEELKIEKGQLFGLVGNNGAGKTTLFNLVLDLIVPSKGQVISQGIVVQKSDDWKAFTGAFIDESFTIGYLTPDEYFTFVGELREMNQSDREIYLKEFDEFFNGEIRGKKKFIRDLSKGNQKKVGIAAAMMGKPEVVVLDEPFANLDPSSQYKLRTLIKKQAAEQGTTFLISGHTLDNITEVCSRIVILEKGKIVKDVPKTETTLKELEAFFAGVLEPESFTID
ncbi:ABC transporter ATP-binding protein [Mangrovibacterium diazotrophicum]|uniref:ABC-2 type transport system ATP-binding protein n=1 Tax=Mangrovibacterium diazotrophicum TaxID=1261403 RepID=A0A419WAN8_9BACT|nr:ABC transporter ATP-binding protein [Mangrovibacterium diazotrophicum]RKD92509.1 ABC-2 type transport system ATP-binding protein [Mangrovibacterium diazotrophicum]